MENNAEAEQYDLWDDAALMLFKKHNPNTDVSSPVGDKIYQGFLKDMLFLRKIFLIQCKDENDVDGFEISSDENNWLFTKEQFEKRFSYKEWEKIAKVVHHAEKPETDVTKIATIKLGWFCDKCSNCSGLSCAAIVIPKTFISLSQLQSKP